MNTPIAMPVENQPQVMFIEEPLYEVVAGKRVELPPMSAFQTNIASLLSQYLGLFARTHHLGRVVGEMLFLIDPEKDLQRRPDVAYVSFQRWPRQQRVPRESAWAVVPELAVEIVSKTNTAQEIVGKIGEYFQAGVQRVWVVYPSQELVYVYDSPIQVHILTRNDELDGEQLLPGFRLPVKTWFEEEADLTPGS